MIVSGGEAKLILLFTTLIFAVMFSIESVSLKATLREVRSTRTERPSKSISDSADTEEIESEDALVAPVAKKEEERAKILVVFSGPAGSQNLDIEGHNKEILYEKNTDYFLEYGMDHCDRHDTLIAVGKEYFHQYYPKVQELQKQCSKRVMLITRRNLCYDMETVRLVFEDGGVNDVFIEDYDHFVYLNCGVTGPHPDHRRTWLDQLLGALVGDVHMSGLSLNCRNAPHHVQSMLYALTREGVRLVRDLPFDCLERSKTLGHEVDFWDIVYGYEVAMGTRLLEAGYGLAQPFIGQLGSPDLPGVIMPHNYTNCTFEYVWAFENFRLFNQDRTPSFSEVGFWKTSKNFPFDIRKLLNYTHEVTW